MNEFKSNENEIHAIPLLLLKRLLTLRKNPKRRLHQPGDLDHPSSVQWLEFFPDMTAT
jgi:hypothetical protein